MKKYLTLAIMVALLWGCDKDEGMDQVQINPAKAPTKGYILPADSVIKIALSAPSAFGNIPQTKSAVSIKSILSLDKLYADTKSSEESSEALANLYVAEYEDDKGFSVISADTRTEQILAYSDKGTFGDAKNTPGVNFFLDNLPAYTEKEISKYELSQKELIASIGPSLLMDSFDPDFEYPVDREITLSANRVTRGPLLSVRWGIYSPFSNLIGSSCGQVVTAILQLMSHYSYPTTGQYAISFNPPSYESFTLDWSVYRGYVFAPLIESDPTATNALSKMAKTIWNSVSALGTVTESSIPRATIALDHYGYRYNGITDYTKYGIINDILENRISIVGGYATKIVMTYKDPSVWLVDGYSSMERRKQIERTWYDGYGNVKRIELLNPVTSNDSYWLHCNWGYDGRSDGYFYDGVFDMANPAQSDNLFTSESNAHFKHRLKQINGIMPK